MSAQRHAGAPRLRALVRPIVQPVQEFIATEASGGLLLMIAAALAIAWANSPWSEAYHHLLERHIVVDAGFYRVDESVHWWVNDVAMVVFFFLMGLEIKRELVIGELNSVRRALVPLVAAAGGMVIPALIFLAVVRDPEAARGWGVPIATDIAFALGVATLLGPRVPIGLKVLLLGIAIFDDLGAVAVIAIFYAGDVAFEPLLTAAAILGLTYAIQRVGVRDIPVYVALGVMAWMAVVESGVHPTTVGVAMGLLTPWHSWSEPREFVGEAREILRSIEAESQAGSETTRRHHHAVAVSRLRRLHDASMAPLDRLEHALNPWVAYGILPLFAFANAGVDLRGDALGLAATAPLTWGVALGLLIGKPLGIALGAAVAVRLGAELPSGVRWPGILGMGMLAGIGFTVALFVAQLSYPTAALLAEAKVGIFAGSLVSGVLGYVILSRLSTHNGTTEA
ncbi:MAG: Na+/H+ antiporter NhaA [Dehalococcoidia bacterium]|nr:Na+/H+ antiporter NhaA [Dehalococcoidia bacterium]